MSRLAISAVTSHLGGLAAEALLAHGVEPSRIVGITAMHRVPLISRRAASRSVRATTPIRPATSRHSPASTVCCSSPLEIWVATAPRSTAT